VGPGRCGWRAPGIWPPAMAARWAATKARLSEIRLLAHTETMATARSTETARPESLPAGGAGGRHFYLVDDPEQLG